MLLFVSAILAVLLALVGHLVSLNTTIVSFVGGPILTILLVWIGVPLVVAPDELRPSPATRKSRELILAQTEEGYGYDDYGYGPPALG